MQTRLLACAAGGLIGVALTSLINNSLGLPSNIAYLACSVAGIGIGYVASIVVHVFTASSETPD